MKKVFKTPVFELVEVTDILTTSVPINDDTVIDKPVGTIVSP